MTEEKDQFVIRVAVDFTKTPGHRYIKQGEYSGEDFRERLLRPAFERAMKAGAKLRVHLEGTQGYATSFLEEAFGGLSRAFGADTVLRHLELRFDDDPLVVKEILDYVRKATPPKS